MQIRHLNTFVAIAEEGTLTAAARRLYKTQGAVSHDLKSLEAELSLQLVDRSGQRVELTPAGEALLPHARELIRRMSDIELLMRRYRLGEGGVIRVGALSSLSNAVLERVMEYQRTVDGLSFSLFSEVRSVLVAWLRDGTLDLAVAEPGLEPDLEVTVVGDDHLLLVLSSDDPLAGSERLTAEDVIDRPFIGFTRELGSSQVAMRFFTPIGRYPTPVMELNDSGLMKEMIRRGRGYGLMPWSTVCDEPDLVAIPPDPHLPRHVGILRRANRMDSAAVLSMERYLAETLRLPAPRRSSAVTSVSTSSDAA